jgi:spermidine synthase
MSRLVALLNAAMVGCISLSMAEPSNAGISSFDGLPVHRIGEMERSIGFYQAIEMVENSLLYSKQSKYQSIEVHQSKFYGKMLVLDGVVQLTERDADSYNEMMAHIPMFQHPNPKRVLIVGGGDGYVLKEVSRSTRFLEKVSFAVADVLFHPSPT